jgi:superfamily II DNA or RNA helicase
MKRRKPTKEQQSAISDVAERLPGCVTLVAPTGSGKSSVLGPELVRLCLDKGLRVLWISPGPHLAIDAAVNLSRSGLSVHAIVSGYSSGDHTARVTVTSLWTLHARRRRPFEPLPLFPADGGLALGFDVVVWDEVQKLTGLVSRTHREALSKASHVNLTATAYVGTHALPTAILGEMVLAGDPALMVQLGLIAPAVVKCPTHAPLHKLLRKHARGRAAMVFCRSVERAREVVAHAEDDGDRFALVTASMAPRDRRKVYARLESGDLDAVVGVGCFIEGTDLARPSVAIFDHAPRSRTKWFQAIGRVRRLRRKQGQPKIALILDPCQAVLEHGLPDDASSVDPIGGVFICPKCFCANRTGCPTCDLQTVRLDDTTVLSDGDRADDTTTQEVI